MTKLLDDLSHMEGAAWKCIRMAHFFDLVSAHPSDDRFWIFVQNALGESACLLWCHLFGSRSDPLHYTKLVAHAEVEALGTRFSPAAVKGRLLAHAGLNDATFDALWEQVKRCRDKYIAHRQPDAEVEFPQLDRCVLVAEAFRDLLADVVDALRKQQPRDGELLSLHRFYREQTNATLKRSCEREFLAGLKSASTWAQAGVDAAHGAA